MEKRGERERERDGDLLVDWESTTPRPLYMTLRSSHFVFELSSCLASETALWLSLAVRLNTKHAGRSSASSHRLMHVASICFSAETANISTPAFAYKSHTKATVVPFLLYIPILVRGCQWQGNSNRKKPFHSADLLTFMQIRCIFLLLKGLNTCLNIFEALLVGAGADVLLYRASPNRAFEASNLGHPARDSGINSNTN